MIHSLMMFLLLAGLAQSLRAQNPAVRMTQGAKKECVRVTLKNLAINAQPLEKVQLATLPDSYSSAQS
jgi:hypothetical protein